MLLKITYHFFFTFFYSLFSPLLGCVSARERKFCYNTNTHLLCPLLSPYSVFCVSVFPLLSLHPPSFLLQSPCTVIYDSPALFITRICSLTNLIEHIKYSCNVWNICFNVFLYEFLWLLIKFLLFLIGVITTWLHSSCMLLCAVHFALLGWNGCPEGAGSWSDGVWRKAHRCPWVTAV